MKANSENTDWEIDVQGTDSVGGAEFESTVVTLKDMDEKSLLEIQELAVNIADDSVFYLGENSPYPNLEKKHVKLISVRDDGLAQYQYKDELIITIESNGRITYLPNEI